jgi:hypothetical protein
MRKRKVPNNTEKTAKQPTVTVQTVPGEVSEHQKKLFRAFWTRLIAECQDELKAQKEAKGD